MVADRKGICVQEQKMFMVLLVLQKHLKWPQQIMKQKQHISDVRDYMNENLKKILKEYVLMVIYKAIALYTVLSVHFPKQKNRNAFIQS